MNALELSKSLLNVTDMRVVVSQRPDLGIIYSSKSFGFGRSGSTRRYRKSQVEDFMVIENMCRVSLVSSIPARDTMVLRELLSKFANKSLVVHVKDKKGRDLCSVSIANFGYVGGDYEDLKVSSWFYDWRPNGYSLLSVVVERSKDALGWRYHI